VLASLPPVDASLAIFDDVFPNLLTAFRVAEFNAYLEHWPSAVVSSTNWFPTASGRVGFRAAIKEYRRVYPQFSKRVLHRSRRVRATHGYCVFINNAAEYVHRFEQEGWPFLFTLYPGGGFELTAECARRIERVVQSPMFRGMIVTQAVTLRWLDEQRLVDPALTHFIWGVALPGVAEFEREWWPEKPHFDVAFVAHKYVPGGFDKGYDLFVDAARQLAAEQPNARFHVVGNWSRDDQPVDDILDRVRFYGPLASADLHRLYQSVDVIVSPSRPFYQDQRFDGYPLGAAVEAGLRGAVVIATDGLEETGPFVRDELIVVKPDADQIAQSLSELASNPELLRQTASRGQEAFRRAYDYGAQLAPRIRLLEGLLRSN
jgi:glycosyltransferase involved in cell wall biosynthesis